MDGSFWRKIRAVTRLGKLSQPMKRGVEKRKKKTALRSSCSLKKIKIMSCFVALKVSSYLPSQFFVREGICV